MELTKKQIEGIRCMKEWQLSDYAWNEPQKKMIKTFLKKMLEKWAIHSDDTFPEAVKQLSGGSFYIMKEAKE